MDRDINLLDKDKDAKTKQSFLGRHVFLWTPKVFFFFEKKYAKLGTYKELKIYIIFSFTLFHKYISQVITR